MCYTYGDLLKEKETGNLAIIDYGSYHSSIYCIKFLTGTNSSMRYQMSNSDIKSKFDKTIAICPKCGHKLSESNYGESNFQCLNCNNIYNLRLDNII